MKRRGFIRAAAAGAAGAVSGAFVVRNPTILDNGLVVPETVSDQYKSDRAELVDVIAPREIGKPITVATSEPIPASARFVGYLDYCDLNVTADAYDVTSLASPVKEYVQGPISAELNMKLTSGQYGWDAIRGAMNEGEEVEVYLVRRKKRDWTKLYEDQGINLKIYQTGGTISITSVENWGGTAMYYPYGSKWPMGT